MNFPFHRRWMFTDVLRNILKIFVSLVWAVALPLLFFQSVDTAPEQFQGWLLIVGKMKGVPPLYVVGVAVYFLPNLLAVALFPFPILRSWLEKSDWLIVRLLMWWAQVS